MEYGINKVFGDKYNEMNAINAEISKMTYDSGYAQALSYIEYMISNEFTNNEIQKCIYDALQNLHEDAVKLFIETKIEFMKNK